MAVKGAFTTRYRVSCSSNPHTLSPQVYIARKLCYKHLRCRVFELHSPYVARFRRAAYGRPCFKIWVFSASGQI